MLDKRSHMPLYAQLKDELADCIKHGTLSVGSQIQTEAELMKQYGIGRATVREAVALLVSEGYLVKRQGIGTFVSNRQPSMGFEPLISLTTSLRARGVNPRNVIVCHEKSVPGPELLTQLRWTEPETCTPRAPCALCRERPTCSRGFVVLARVSEHWGAIRPDRLSFAHHHRRAEVDITRIDQVIVPRLPSPRRKRFSSSREMHGSCRWTDGSTSWAGKHPSTRFGSSFPQVSTHSDSDLCRPSSSRMALDSLTLPGVSSMLYTFRTSERPYVWGGNEQTLAAYSAEASATGEAQYQLSRRA